MRNNRVLLIVDRWPTTVANLSQALKRTDLRIIGTVDPKEAVDCLETQNPGAIIIDPEVRGGQVLLERTRQTPGLFVIVTTKSDETARSVRALGFEDVVIKDDHFVGNILDAYGRFDGERTPDAQGYRLRVLVVDDHPDMLDLFASYLSSRGCDVLTAEDGESALRSLDWERTIDVVSLDMMLPGIDGIETLDAIMRRKDPPGVLMVSALSDDRIARRARDLGAFEYLTKPVDMDRYEASLIACAEGRKHVTRD